MEEKQSVFPEDIFGSYEDLKAQRSYILSELKGNRRELIEYMIDDAERNYDNYDTETGEMTEEDIGLYLDYLEEEEGAEV